MYIIVELVRMNSQAIRLCCTAIRPGYSYVDLVIQSSCLQTVWPAYKPFILLVNPSASLLTVHRACKPIIQVCQLINGSAS